MNYPGIAIFALFTVLAVAEIFVFQDMITAIVLGLVGLLFMQDWRRHK